MNLSEELVNLVVDVTNKAIPLIEGTNGPLQSFLTIETADGMRGEKEYPHGTNDDDLIAAASMEGVQRFALVSSGSVQTSQGTAPVLLIHAAERGDPKGFVLAQRFVPGQDPVYTQLEGAIEVIQAQDTHFRFAPPEITSDRERNGILLQESLVRFAKRLMGQAFGDDDPTVLSVALSVVEGEQEAQGSFGYVHGPSETMLRVDIAYRENRFIPTALQQIGVDGSMDAAPEELVDAILAVY